MSDTWIIKGITNTKQPASPKEEEVQICSSDSLQKACKQKRTLVIVTDEEEVKFAQEFKDKVTPDDLRVVHFNKGGSCEALETLGLKGQSGAVLLDEDGKVKLRYDLTKDAIKDTAGLTRMILEKDNGVCTGKITVGNGNWNIEPDPGTPCDEELSDAKLPSGTEKYLRKHIENQPPA